MAFSEAIGSHRPQLAGSMVEILYIHLFVRGQEVRHQAVGETALALIEVANSWVPRIFLGYLKHVQSGQGLSSLVLTQCPWMDPYLIKSRLGTNLFVNYLVL